MAVAFPPSLQEDHLSGHVTAILDQGTHFEGKLSFEGTVQIGGDFKGEIFTKDTIVINEGATVLAQIEADTIVISGRVEGNLFARRRVIMHPPAIFKGTVTSPSLRIDEGVVFEGASYMPKS
ncbi:polymer-forming cytoskeletal protein [Bdellovibrio bacteriovorus]|uniref:Polymer-forming cytoskeletal protein n=1 Tax=Bdellovibrio reynosensis TaxID=2835041 RepID=A0ABY4C6A3_9BACT|nr:polymer-forming cytoskeletal protein [Bdellovibrio reynosensis]UOF00408.1 polymer-forming cytoskeletal protein [Bdellovibrio reynosensis]